MILTRRNVRSLAGAQARSIPLSPLQSQPVLTDARSSVSHLAPRAASKTHFQTLHCVQLLRLNGEGEQIERNESQEIKREPRLPQLIGPFRTAVEAGAAGFACLSSGGDSLTTLERASKSILPSLPLSMASTIAAELQIMAPYLSQADLPHNTMGG